MRKILAQIPNVLTVIRILLIPVIIYLLQKDMHQLGLIIFIMAAVTDALDGFIAKSFKIISKFGTYLDPIADKLLLNSIYAVLAVMGWLPIWLAALVWLRDLVIFVGAATLKLRGYTLNIKPALVGKATTLSQFVTGCLFFDVGISKALVAWQPIFVAATAILTLWSGGHYVMVGIKMDEKKTVNPAKT